MIGIAPNGRRAYVANGANSVAVLDLTTSPAQVLETLTGMGTSAGIVVSPTKAEVYITQYAATGYLNIVSTGPGVTSVSYGTGGTAGASGSKAGTGTLTLTGTEFGTSGSPKLTSVKLGAGADEVSCTSLAVTNNTTATCTLPAYNGAFTDGRAVVPVTVGGSATWMNTFKLNNAFAYVDTPTVTSVSPLIGPTSGTGTLTVTGTGFYSAASGPWAGTTVTVDGSPCPLSQAATATQVTCMIPSHAAGQVAVAVTTNGGALPSATTYTFLDMPGVPGTPSATAGVESATVTWTAPSSGGAPDTYTVTSNPAGGTCQVSHPTLTCTVPSLTAGVAYDFTVTATNDAGASSASSASTPTVTPTAPPVTPSSSGGSSSSTTPSVVTTAPTAKPAQTPVPVAEQPAVAPVIAPVVKPTVVRLTGPVVSFAPMSATLGAPMKTALSALAKKIGKRPARIVVTGYVQPSATTGNDASLSKARAQAVVDYLRSKGVKGTFVARGGGAAKKPGTDGRRVDIAIIYRK